MLNGGVIEQRARVDIMQTLETVNYKLKVRKLKKRFFSSAYK